MWGQTRDSWDLGFGARPEILTRVSLFARVFRGVALVQDLGLRVESLGVRVKGWGFGVEGLGFRV